MKKRSKEQKAFTLVELIVVLVILAILAAILVPALLGYIDRAKQKQDVLEARYYKQACQTVLSELYAQGELPNYDHNNNLMSGNNTSYSWSKDYRKRILKLVGEADPSLIDKNQATVYEPYLIIYLVGRYPKYKDGSATEKHYAYTCYTVFYKKDASSDLIILTPDGVQSVAQFAQDRSDGKNGGRDWVMVNGVKIETVAYCGEVHEGNPTTALNKIENGTYK